MSDEEWDMEAEWAEARLRAGLSASPFEPEGREDLWLLPVLVLYTGFFFGPFATILFAVAVLKGRIALRDAALLTGVAGTSWCLIQGLSVLYAPMWSEWALQFMRSGLNFVTGIVAYLITRAPVRDCFATTRKTLIISAIAVVAAAIAFTLIPSKILIAMGR